MSNIFNAAKGGDRAYIERAISSGEANPGLRDSIGNTLLHIVVELKRNEVSIIELLLSHGWDINAQNNFGATPLHYVALRKDSGKNVALLLLKNSASLEITTNLGHTPLHIACERYKLDLVQVYLDHKARPECLDRNNNTPLHILLMSPGRDTIAKDILDVFLKTGVRINSKNNEGNDPLLLACAKGYTKVCQLLLQNGGNPRVVNDMGNTVVHQCAASGHSELVEMLLDLAIPFISILNSEGDTPLHIAVKNNHADVAAVLLRKGSSLTLKNQAGKTPVDLVSNLEKNIFAIKHPELVKIINSTKPKSRAQEEDDDIGCVTF
jgi:uncharacterized protein